MGSVAEADEPEDEGAEEAEEGEKGIEEGEAGLVEVVGLLDEERGLRKPDRGRLPRWEDVGGHCENVFSPHLMSAPTPPPSIPSGPYALMLRWFESKERSVRLSVRVATGEGSKEGGVGGGGGGRVVGLKEAREALVRRVRGSL